MKICAVFGTRPEAIKMAPVISELQAHPRWQTVTVVTAQHREMLDQVLALFNIEPDYDLNIMREGQSLEEITSRALDGLSTVFRKESPDLVLVHGDTTTTFTGALAAFYNRIAAGHVEAGLRTGLKYAPFPEEINRSLTAVLSDIHFAPTAAARSNLLKEGIPPEKIFVTGNTVIDALLSVVREDYAFEEAALRSLDFNRRVILVTVHRRENWGRPLREIFTALKNIVRRYRDVEVVFPVHRNPRVHGPASEILGGEERIKLVEPLGYLPFVNLMARCYFVMTDSGGLQEEAPSLGKPVLVLREATERPEAVEAGTVKLVGTAGQRVEEAAAGLLEDPRAYRKMARAVNPYGDGRASKRIAAALLYYFGCSRARPGDYFPGG